MGKFYAESLVGGEEATDRTMRSRKPRLHCHLAVGDDLTGAQCIEHPADRRLEGCRHGSRRSVVDVAALGEQPHDRHRIGKPADLQIPDRLDLGVDKE